MSFALTAALSAAFVSLGSALALAGAPASAAAPAPAPATKPIAFASTPVDLASLAAGGLLDVDRSKKPASIPRNRHVAGVKVDDRNAVGRSHARRKRKRSSSNEAAVLVTEDGRAEDDDEPADICFDSAALEKLPSAGRDARKPSMPRKKLQTRFLRDGNVATAAKKETWAAQTKPTIALERQPPVEKYDDRVQLVHVESFEHEPNGGASLHVRDIWVDVETRGALLQREDRLPLRDLGPQLTGVHLYAGKTKDDVVFVAVRDKTIEDATVKKPNDSGEGSQCGHLVMALALQRGASTHALLVVVPKHEVPQDPDDVDAGVEVHQRAGHVAVSVQWEPEETAPLASYSSGWDERDHVTQ